MRLIRKWLRAPIQINGRLVKRRKGVPQGSPLSPILSNIMLHELDKWRKGGSSMSVTQMTLVSIQKVSLKPGR